MYDKKWKVKKEDGKIYGPADTETFKRWIQENRISGEDEVSAADTEEWKKLTEIEEFASFFIEKKTFLLPEAQQRTLTTQVISDGWQILKVNFFPIIGSFLLYLVISGGVSFGLRKLSFVGPIISHLIAGPLIVGWSWYCLCKIRKQEISPIALFEGFKIFLPALGAYLLITILTILGLIALIAPALILFSAYALTYFFIIDKKMGPWEAMKASFNITKGYRWRILAVTVLCYFIGILGFFSFAGLWHLPTSPNVLLVVILCIGFAIGGIIPPIFITLSLGVLYERLTTGNIHESQKQTNVKEFLLGGFFPAIAIIGILAAILIPALFKASETARRITEITNESITTESNKPIFTNPTKPIITGKPIPAASYVYTDRKYREDKKKWRKEMLIDNYNKYGTQSPLWDSKVQYFLTDVVELIEGSWNRELVEDLKSTSSKLMAVGCSDPFIVYLHGYLLYQSGEKEKAESFVHKGLTMLENSNYPKMFIYYAANRLAIIEEELNKEAEEIHSQKLKYFAWAMSTADMDFPNGQKRLITEDFYSVWNGISFETKEWLFNYLNKITTTSDPWIVEIIKGNYYIKKAWEIRGSGVASTVTKEGWKGFKEELGKAKESLTKAYELHPEYPEAASLMIGVSMGLSDSAGERMWFDRAVEAQMDYIPAYNNMLYAMLPRWGGSYEKMYAFGLECLNTKRFDTDVPWKFLTVIWDIGKELEDWKDAYGNPGVYENIQQLLEGLLNEPTRKYGRNYYQTVYGIVAWATERYDDAKKIFDELSERADISAFNGFNVRKELVIGEVNARASAFKDDIQRAEELFTQNQSLEALPLFEKASDTLKNDTIILPYLRDRIVTLRFKKELKKDDWVDFIPPEDFAGWSIDIGEWSIEKDGSIKGIPSWDGLRLMCNTYIDGNFEIKGEIEAEWNGGMRLNYYKSGWGERQINFRISCRENKAYLSGSEITSSEKPITCKSKNTFLLQVWDSHITVYINAQPVFTNQETNKEWGYSEKRQIGLWGWYGGRYSSPPVRLRNLQIRRLETKPL